MTASVDTDFSQLPIKRAYRKGSYWTRNANSGTQTDA